MLAQIAVLSLLGFTVHPLAPTAPRAVDTSRGSSTTCVAALDGELAELGLTPYLEKTIKGLRMVPDQKLRYQQLLFLAKKLPPMDAALQVEANKVPGCLSTVHVHATANNDGTVNFVGESDAQLTKGLVALLVKGLDGCTNEQIQAVQPEFIQYSGLAQSLTPGRNNGFLNMLSTMKRKAAALCADSPADADADAATDVATDATTDAATGAAARTPPPTMLASSALGPVGRRMAATLEAAFSPSVLELMDESDQHAGHAGAKGLDGESHFALVIEADAFEGLRGLKRHQLVYDALGEEMKNIHALSIKARTAAEA